MFIFKTAGHGVIGVIAFETMPAEERTEIADLLRVHHRFGDHFAKRMPDAIKSGTRRGRIGGSMLRLAAGRVTFDRAPAQRIESDSIVTGALTRFWEKASHGSGSITRMSDYNKMRKKAD